MSETVSATAMKIIDEKAKRIAELEQKLAVATEALEYYADQVCYSVGSGANPEFSNEFGAIIEHGTIAVMDDYGEIARAALEKMKG